MDTSAKRYSYDKNLDRTILVEQLNYDPITGFFHRKSGKRAGCTRADGYRSVGVRTGISRVTRKGKVICAGSASYLEHRLAVLWMTGTMPSRESGLDVDHIDGNRANNAWDNLRVITHQENIQCAYKRTRLPRGVAQTGNKYIVTVCDSGRTFHYGPYSVLDTARSVAIAARKSLRMAA